jgi:hypothetical protein
MGAPSHCRKIGNYKKKSLVAIKKAEKFFYRRPILFPQVPILRVVWIVSIYVRKKLVEMVVAQDMINDR